MFSRRSPFGLAASLTLAAVSCTGEGGGGGDSATAEGRVFAPTQYSVADFYGNKEFFGASFSPDRQKILVGSNLSGIWNAYAVPVAGGDPQPLTSSTKNSIFPVSYFPADERILYSSDEGGNELAHLYIRNADGSVTDLTPGRNLVAQFHGWAGDDKSFFVATNERDPRFFDLYEVAIDGLARRLVYRNDEGFNLGVLSRDKRYLALVKSYTTADQDIFVHDLQTKSTTNVTKHTGAVGNAPADFTPDGTKLLFTSDSGREFSSLRSYDLASGAKAAVYEQDWDVAGARYSKSEQETL